MWSVLVLVLYCATSVKGVTFSNAARVGTVTSHSITEASGLCASRLHPDVLYTHNDSGGTHRIFAISAKSGSRLATIYIDGAHSLDWEDIACGPCPKGTGGHCIYIADTGGNAGGDANTIYRIREPSQIHDQHVQLESKLMFSWDQHDCETVMVDAHGSIYVVSKVHGGQHPKLVHLPSSAWGTNHREYINHGVFLPITPNYSPVAGDISPAGTEVLIKTYGSIYYWSIPDKDYYRHMTQGPQKLPYHGEKQGESICWDQHGNGYYTVSEGANVPLYYYRRTSAPPFG